MVWMISDERQQLYFFFSLLWHRNVLLSRGRLRATNAVPSKFSVSHISNHFQTMQKILNTRFSLIKKSESVTWTCGSFLCFFFHLVEQLLNARQWWLNFSINNMLFSSLLSQPFKEIQVFHWKCKSRRRIVFLSLSLPHIPKHPLTLSSPYKKREKKKENFSFQTYTDALWFFKRDGIDWLDTILNNNPRRKRVEEVGGEQSPIQWTDACTKPGLNHRHTASWSRTVGGSWRV